MNHRQEEFVVGKIGVDGENGYVGIYQIEDGICQILFHWKDFPADDYDFPYGTIWIEQEVPV